MGCFSKRFQCSPTECNSQSPPSLPLNNQFLTNGCPPLLPIGFLLIFRRAEPGPLGAIFTYNTSSAFCQAFFMKNFMKIFFPEWRTWVRCLEFSTTKQKVHSMSELRYHAIKSSVSSLLDLLNSMRFMLGSLRAKRYFVISFSIITSAKPVCSSMKLSSFVM